MATDRTAEVKQVQDSLDFDKNTYTVEMETTKGPVRLEFFPDVAPGHVKNFLALAKIGFYNGIKFHRIIKGFVVQGGCPLGTGTGDAGYKIPAEFNNRIHEAGVLSMARANDPDSAGSQFFLCLGRLTSLDNQYTVFGKVSDEESLQTVLALGDVQTDRGDKPVSDVAMINVTVKETPK